MSPLPHSIRIAWVAILAPFVATLPLHAADYSESVSGDLSSKGSAPTIITVAPGANVVSGKMGRGADVAGATDADVWSFNIAEGQQLTAITFEQLTGSSSLGTGSFFAVAAGQAIDQSSAAGHLSNMLVTQTGDVLGTLAASKMFTLGFGSPSGASGMTSPLGPGDYTFWLQEAGAASVDYSIRFDIQAVPEPSTFALMALGMGGLVRVMAQKKVQNRGKGSGRG